MDYKQITDRLFERITAADLAAELRVSQNAVARARLDPQTRDYRPPPPSWQEAVVKLARKRAVELITLAEQIEGD